MYRRYIKRPMDFLLSLCGILVLSPVFISLIVIGFFAMKGNPFFAQPRPGKDEKIFKLIKFRTMTCETDQNGKLLPDVERLTKYGRFLRSTSLDELPELFNILIGDMSIVGPRPLLVEYLPLYNKNQRQRHTVFPGLTGLAQVNGRNLLTWEEKFELDVKYTNNITFKGDLNIVVATIISVLKREGISQKNSATAEMFTGTPEGEVVNV